MTESQAIPRASSVLLSVVGKMSFNQRKSWSELGYVLPLCRKPEPRNQVKVSRHSSDAREKWEWWGKQPS
jgi:hypothetical protein